MIRDEVITVREEGELIGNLLKHCYLSPPFEETWLGKTLGS